MRLEQIAVAVCALTMLGGWSSAPVQAENLDRYQPKLPEVEVTRSKAQSEVTEGVKAGGAEAQQVLLKRLEGLVFVPGVELVKKEGSRAKGIVLNGIEILEKDRGLKKMMEERMGQPLTFADLTAITRQVVECYVKNGHPVVDAFVPEQFIEGGTVQIVVIEGKLGQVRAVGNKWFKDDLLTSGIRAMPGGVLDRNQIEADADYLNGNPFRRVVPTFVRGSEPGTTDIELRTQDRFPFRVYTGYEDNGSDLTGDERWMGGFNWGNAFGLDHQLNYQFTTSSNFWHFKAHSASYVIPIRALRHRLTLMGSYGTSNADVPAPFAMDGESWQVGLRYAIPLAGPDWLSHEVVGGFDFKQSDNNLEFGGVEVFDTRVDVAQFVLGYSATETDKLGSTRRSRSRGAEAEVAMGSAVCGVSPASRPVGMPG